MLVARSIQDIRRIVAGARSAGRTIGLVPTMGALHAGHASLLDAAQRDGCFTLATIFVNPTQFGPNEDFSRYPRSEAADLALCRSHGAEAVFAPPTEVMYRGQSLVSVHVGKLADHLCGPHRPGHFVGVATVVAKLFNIALPDVAYFGEKDAQQLAIIRRMVEELDFPIRIVGCPTIREADGLALSSRNAYLSPAERKQAASLYAALRYAAEAIQAGQRDSSAITAQMRVAILAAGPASIDYISIVDPVELAPVSRIDADVLVALAVRIGATRLIDNLTVRLAAG